MDPVTDVLGRGRDPPMGRVTFGGHTLAHTDVLPVDILNVICKRAAGPTVAVLVFLYERNYSHDADIMGIGEPWAVTLLLFSRQKFVTNR